MPCIGNMYKYCAGTTRMSDMEFSWSVWDERTDSTAHNWSMWVEHIGSMELNWSV